MVVTNINHPPCLRKRKLLSQATGSDIAKKPCKTSFLCKTDFIENTQNMSRKRSITMANNMDTSLCLRENNVSATNERKVRLPMDCNYEKRLKLSLTSNASSLPTSSLPCRPITRSMTRVAAAAALAAEAAAISANPPVPHPLAGAKRPISSYRKQRRQAEDDRYIPKRDLKLWEQAQWIASRRHRKRDDQPFVGIYVPPPDAAPTIADYSLTSPISSSDPSSVDQLYISSAEDIHSTVECKKAKKTDEVYHSLLQNEILNQEIVEDKQFFNSDSSGIFEFSNNTTNKDMKGVNSTALTESTPYCCSSPRSKTGPILSPCSVKLLKSPRKAKRKICGSPYKVLDAPELADDFYLNLVDWSDSNMLAVGLNTCVYLWNANTSAVTRLCDLSTVSDIVTSVAWSSGGEHIAVGTTRGFVQVWDVCANKQVTMLTGHSARVGSLAWNDASVCSGSRDRTILIRDVRAISGSARGLHRKLLAHRQEVCGLKWSPDKQLLASGGNDNHLIVWSANNTIQPLHVFADHIAAVKAIAWSPHQFGLLASGGGTADRRIRFWNTLTGQGLHSVDTGSQVCNLAWSPHLDEIVSTHGYSQNQIIVWIYPSMNQLVKLTGHSYRVLYLACAPDGESVVTGAGDETLRFWNVFEQASKTNPDPITNLDVFGKIR